MSIVYNGNGYNGYINIAQSQLLNASAFIELIDGGDRMNFAISGSSSDDPLSTTFDNWSNGIKFTTFDISRNFVSKDVIIYWKRSNGTFDWSNITIGASNEIDSP